MDCCDHKNPVPPYQSDDEAYMDWYNDYQSGYDVDGWDKIQSMRKQRRQDKQYRKED
jgi:hypothetical protein